MQSSTTKPDYSRYFFGSTEPKDETVIEPSAPREDRTGEFVLHWGRHKGKPLKAIPSFYLNKLLDTYPELLNRDAIERYLVRHNKRFVNQRND